MFSVEYEFEQVYCVTTAAVINRDCMSCDTPLRFIAWSPGIAREQTCNGCCRNWQLIGHVHIAGTQRYLTLTPELLHAASQRFEQYARGGQHE